MLVWVLRWPGMRSTASERRARDSFSTKCAGASSFEELIAKSREREASRKSCSQPQTEQEQQQEQQDRAPASASAEPEQHHSQAGAVGSDAGPNRLGSPHETDQPERPQTLARDPRMQHCNGHAMKDGNAAGDLPGTAQCTVYARGPSDKLASMCNGGLPIQNGFLEPLAWQGSVPDSGSE